jgi:hypothetical protein
VRPVHHAGLAAPVALDPEEPRRLGEVNGAQRATWKVNVSSYSVCDKKPLRDRNCDRGSACCSGRHLFREVRSHQGRSRSAKFTFLPVPLLAVRSEQTQRRSLKGVHCRRTLRNHLSEESCSSSPLPLFAMCFLQRLRSNSCGSVGCSTPATLLWGAYGGPETAPRSGDSPRGIGLMAARRTRHRSSCSPSLRAWLPGRASHAGAAARGVVKAKAAGTSKGAPTVVRPGHDIRAMVVAGAKHAHVGRGLVCPVAASTWFWGTPIGDPCDRDGGLISRGA